MLTIFSHIVWPLAWLMRSFDHHFINSWQNFESEANKLKKRDQNGSHGTATHLSLADYKEGRSVNHDHSTYFRIPFLIVYAYFPHKTEINDQCVLGVSSFLSSFFFKVIRDGLFWS